MYEMRVSTSLTCSTYSELMSVALRLVLTNILLLICLVLHKLQRQIGETPGLLLEATGQAVMSYWSTRQEWGKWSQWEKD